MRNPRKILIVAAACLAALPALGGCGGNGVPPVDTGTVSTVTGPPPATTAFTLTSQNFQEGGAIPPALACQSKNGGNQPPQLSWYNPPAGTAFFAVMMEDQNPPCGAGDSACRHWSVFNIPGSVTQLPCGRGVSGVPGAVEGQNYLGQSGYAGPCSPVPHTYNITVYALKTGVPASSDTAVTRSSFQAAYGDLILGSATLSGTFTP